MRRLLLIAWGALLLLAACRKDDRLVDLTAVVADQPARGSAKVYVDNDRYACWHHGDYVKINGSNYTLSVTPGSDYKVAKILDVDESDNGYTAAYPASYFSGITEGGTSATVTIPSVQTYVRTTVYDGTGKTYQQLVNPMVAHCGEDEDVLKFRNVACVLKVVVKNRSGYDLDMHFVTVEASSAYLAGTASVSDIGTTTTTAPSMDAPTSGYHGITVDCSASPIVLNNNDDTSLLVVSAPFENQNLTLRVLAKDPDAASHGDTVYYTLIGTSRSTLSLDRNQMGVVEFTVSDCGCAAETGHCDYLFWGCGTEANPFIITSYDDLNRLRNIVNYQAPYNSSDFQTTYNTNSIHYLQIMDVNIGSRTTTWGANNSTIDYSMGYHTTYPFKANYNGGDHKLTLNSTLGGNITPNGYDYGIGVFGTVGGGGSISHVVTTGSISADSRDAIVFGGVVGLICGPFSVSDCKSSVNISLGTYSGNDEFNGGICGYVNAPACTVNIANCTCSGTMTSGQLVCFGSIVAKVANAALCTISSCSNTSKNISASYGSVGGLVGDAAAPVSFSACTNNWSITDAGKYKVGGLIGNTASTVAIDGCTNNGAISCSGQVGGFVGYASGKVTISGTSSNTAEIEATATISNAGGCVGEAEGEVSITGTLSNSGYIHGGGARIAGIVAHVLGKISIDGNVTNSGDIYVSGNYGNLGGIIGYSESVCHINKDCSDLSKKVINTGQLTSGGTNHGAGTHAMGNGGIVGTAIGTICIKNCYNEGLVSLKCSVGGIVGCVSLSGVSFIESCLNTGDVRGWNTASWGNGGIVGDLACASNTTPRFYIRNCGNEGDVITGYNNGNYKGYAAGIAGFVYSNGNIYLDIKNCYSKGSAISGVKVGGIITSKVFSTYKSDITIDNCYFQGTLTGSTGAASVSYNDGPITHLYYTHCYSDNTTDAATPTANEGIDNKSSGAKKAARTFLVSNGMYANRSATVSSSEWSSGTTLVNALNSQVTALNEYRNWSVPSGQVLPTLGL